MVEGGSSVVGCDSSKVTVHAAVVIILAVHQVADGEGGGVETQGSVGGEIRRLVDIVIRVGQLEKDHWESSLRTRKSARVAPNNGWKDSYYSTIGREYGGPSCHFRGLFIPLLGGNATETTRAYHLPSFGSSIQRRK